MALPNPIPDNPLRWDGWRNYNSANFYERLCLDYSSNANNELIEENCRQLLVWWQKKLPLKNQPSNPMAQMLRQGLDEAPQYLAEARNKLLDPKQRELIDQALHTQIIKGTLEEFKKLLLFALADKKLTAEAEEKLYLAGQQLGLTREEILPVLEEELERTGSIRFSPPPPPPPAPSPAPSTVPVANEANGDPASEFRRLLRMSRLCLDGEDMTDDQRDAMCNMGESLGLTGGQAEDLIDEYLEECAIGGVSIPQAPARSTPVSRVTTVPTTPPPQATPPAQEKRPVNREVNLSPAARVAERKRYPNFSNPLGIEFFLIPSGRYEMGINAVHASPNEQPATPVQLSCFYLSRHPITNGQYEAYDPGHRNKRAPWADEHHPVIFVSWVDADAFCKWLSQREGRRYRLPTEAEWEYAARGDDGRLYPWGNRLAAGNLANFADARSNFIWRDSLIDDGYAETSPVGTYPRGASPFGIEDLAGNVFEWCLDPYAPYRGKELINPRPAAEGGQRVYRGGSWKSRAASLRSTARQANVPTYFANDVGFRILCECD